MATIVLDPGHGGTKKVGGSSPNNATGPTGLLEKTVTLQVGLAARKALAGSGVTVLMTRDTDKNLGIAARAGVAKSARADAFVSIHFNAAEHDKPPAQGTETWIGAGHTPGSLALAREVQRQVLGVTQVKDRGVKVGSVSGVINPANHDPHTANCLVEISFLDRQPVEEKRLRDQAYLDALGDAIAQAVLADLRGRGLLAAGQAADIEQEPEDAASARRLGLITDTEFAGEPPAATEFEAPPEVAEDADVAAPPASEDRDAFDPPDQGADAEPRPENAEADDEPLAAAAIHVVPRGVDPDLIAMHRELEGLLFARPPIAAFGAEMDRPPAPVDMILGVGIGPAHRDFESVGSAGPGAPVINLYVAEPMSMDRAKAIVADNFGVRALSADRTPVNILHTGQIDAYGHRHRERPSPCGISVGHHRVTAGTQGVLARGRSGQRERRLLLLSNNHVLANANDCKAGDPIMQPGPLDLAAAPGNQIGILEQWVPLDFDAGATNVVDCATAWCWPDRVRKDFLYPGASGFSYFRVGSAPIPAFVGMMVGKSGRTTQLTSGRVIDVNASIRVNYGGGRVANFRDQISIRGNNNLLFSQGGDSGSLIWQWDQGRTPVGLLFAGGGQLTFANKLDHVLAALDLSLYT